MSRHSYRNTTGQGPDYTNAWIGLGMTVLAVMALSALFVFLPDNPTLANARPHIPTGSATVASPPALGVRVSPAPMPARSEPAFWGVLLDVRDDYERCLIAMDAAEVPAHVGSCKDPRVKATRPARVQEDSPRWSCRTMGDRVCSEALVVYGSTNRWI